MQMLLFCKLCNNFVITIEQRKSEFAVPETAFVYHPKKQNFLHEKRLKSGGKSQKTRRKFAYSGGFIANKKNKKSAEPKADSAEKNQYLTGLDSRYLLTISATLNTIASSNSLRSRPVIFLIFSSL